MPQAGITAAALANLNGAPAERLLHGAVNAELGLPLETPKVVLSTRSVKTTDLAHYEGEYKDQEVGHLRARVAESHLLIEVSGHAFPARPVAEDVFAFRPRPHENELTVRFLRKPGEPAWAVQFGYRTIRRA